MAIQLQVVSGETSYNSGLAILELIYGIKGDEGRSILGNETDINKAIAEKRQDELNRQKDANSQGSK